MRYPRRVSSSPPDNPLLNPAHLGGTVLIVDDDQPNLDVMRSFLEPGLRVIEASSGDLALEYLSDPALDLIITDQRMPGMSGVQLLQLAKQSRPDVAGIVVTAYTDTAALLAAINQAAAFRFLRKPWLAADLMQAVAAAREYVGQRRAITALAAELRAKNQDLERTVDALHTAQSQLLEMERLVITGRMAAGIAHDLRNAMNGLLLVEMELASSTADSSLTETLQIGMASLRNLLDQLQTLGTFAKQKRLSMTLDRIDVAKTAQQALALLRLDMDLRRRVVTSTAPEGGCPTIIGDNAKLVQVIVNLLRNAVQATEPGQRIWVAVEHGQGAVQIRVEDEGAGLPDELVAQVFEPFVSTKGDQGLGLGLYMAKLVAEHHRGSLHAGHRSPKGSVFTLSLPLLTAPSP